MIDLWATEIQYWDHLEPVWRALPADVRGTAYLAPRLARRLNHLRDENLGVRFAALGRGSEPVLVASSQDHWRVQRSRGAKVIYLEHGAGQSYEGDPRSAGHTSYSGGERHENVLAFLSPSEVVAERWRHRYPHVPAVAVGCPKLDAFAAARYASDWRGQEGQAKPSRGPDRLGLDKTEGDQIALSFHMDLNLCPETTGAWGHYDRILPRLAQQFRLLGHGHPRLWPHLKHRWQALGVEHTPSFAEVIGRAAVYVADNSSTIPEFAAATGRPVIFLNAPQYRRNVWHGGRYWNWPGRLGPAVDEPEELSAAIEASLADPARGAEGREEALDEIFGPRDAKATDRAVMAVLEALGG